MATASSIAALNFKACDIFGIRLNSSDILRHESSRFPNSSYRGFKPLIVEARANTRTENAKYRDIRSRKKFNGVATKPRLSVFCSKKQLYAMLVDDQKKKCLFYGSTLQKSICGDVSSTADAAKRVGEELIKACVELKIDEISCYDRNGLARGERLQAFEIALGRHGFLR